MAFENLIVTGPGMDNTGATGVAAMTDNGHHLGLRVSNLEISGYHEGLSPFGWGSATAGFGQVLIEDCHVHHNLANGGMTWAEGIGGMRDIAVRRCRFAHNPGDPAATKNSGSGWVFGQVADGLIEHCIAHDNGAREMPPRAPAAYGLTIPRV